MTHMDGTHGTRMHYGREATLAEQMDLYPSSLSTSFSPPQFLILAAPCMVYNKVLRNTSSVKLNNVLSGSWKYNYISRMYIVLQQLAFVCRLTSLALVTDSCRTCCDLLLSKFGVLSHLCQCAIPGLPGRDWALSILVRMLALQVGLFSSLTCSSPPPAGKTRNKTTHETLFVTDKRPDWTRNRACSCGSPLEQYWHSKSSLL